MLEQSGHGIPLLQAINPEKEAIKLVQSDKLDEFVTMLNFLDSEMAIAFAKCVHKCRQYGLKKREEFYFLVARSMVSIRTKGKGGGNRADLFAQVLMGVAVPEFFGGGNAQKRGRNNESSNT